MSTLFPDAPVLPAGLAHVADFLGESEEATLLESLRALPVVEARYRGYLAKRRTVSFGHGYDFSSNRLHDAPPWPEFLKPLRKRAAAWAGIDCESFVHCLVTQYRPGTPIGWHRDVPQFEHVVGISLGSACRLRFRPYPPTKDWTRHTFTLALEPRSAYRMSGDIRWQWQHSIPDVRAERWSITFRTLSRKGASERAQQ
ncbi:MAG TPA: alpha-ketoglutarate-dependent dioxygenase AlkB [Casimicrobiaceae bacterium]|nr:alpha-ketoglutarate-dependent dioxygenase AlkB [Casimicrobiaceae bacterium]